MSTGNHERKESDKCEYLKGSAAVCGDSLSNGSMNVLDARFGNCPKWLLGPTPHLNMRTPENITKSVVFVCYADTSGDVAEKKYLATAFVASIRERGGARYHYLVTARHPLAKRQLTDPHFFHKVEFRVNVLGSEEARYIKHDGRFWFHPDREKSVDVAVCPFESEGIDVVPVEYDNFLSDASIYDYYIGPGDEVAITGLFSRLAGEARNLPILRRGSVAMLPEEKISSVDVGDATSDINGYLIEVRSVGGLSGSPAFVRAPIGINYKVHTRSSKFRIVKAHFQGDYHLLGLCQGHWEIPAGARNSVMPPSGNNKEDSINLGIAIVVPAKEILEVLNHPELAEMRKRADRARADEGG